MSLKILNNDKWNIDFNSKLLLSIIRDNVNSQTVEVSNIDDLCNIIINNAWSPSIFFGGKKIIANFQSTSILGLDIDGGLTIVEAQQKLSGFKYIIAPTRNHNIPKNGITCERFRILLFLSEPIIDVKTYAATWEYASKLIPQVDRACKDVSRQYFKSLFIYHCADGELFPVVKQEPPQKHKLPKLSYPVPKYVEKFMIGDLEGGWNVNLFKSAKLLQESGFEEEQAIQLLSTMTNANYSGALDHSDIKTIKSAFSKEGKYDPQLNWPETIHTKYGTEIVDGSNQNNFLYLIENVLKLDIKFNELRNCIELGTSQWSDRDLSELRMKCRDFHLKPSQEILDDVIRAVAHKNSYHPFKEFVLKEVWDNHDHISDLFDTIEVEGENLPIYKTYLKRWLIGTVARCFNPGLQNNVLVFLGPQAAGKSRWFERFSISPGMYNESSLDPSSKDDKLKTTNTIIWSISELDQVTRKKDQAALKAFITDGVFDVRAPYDRYSKQLKPVCSFVASVNEHNFLVDTTGNRRFLVIPIKKLNVLHNVNIQQVFAQAYSAHSCGERFWFDFSEIQEVNKVNEDYMPTTRMDYICSKIEPGTDQVNADELLTLLGYKDSRTGYDYQALGRSLKAANIEAKRIIKGGQKITTYSIDRKKLEMGV